MSKLPPIPKEQRSFGSANTPDDAKADRRDLKTGLQSGQPGDADVNLSQQGRQANTIQNLTPQRSVQDR
ncbi:hypothetical protein [Brevundimonas sp.]|uniref:hypothetical protein n=1 Tax=Brevundimonas sp. TaxID=1871086 RepID=UPI0025FC6208|nr:hypothetical protein [Brevundimonas sp.]